MKIAVAGSSDYAKILVGLLAARNHKVTVIDKDKEFCEHVCASYDVKAILGNPCQEDVLADAGYKDIFIESLYPVCTLSLVSLYGFLLQ